MLLLLQLDLCFQNNWLCSIFNYSRTLHCYLIKLEDFRDFVLDDLYGIAPCTNPILDTLIDTCFEYSILVNLLLIFSFKRWSRWLLVPWLCVYFVQIVLLLILSVLFFIFPPPLKQPSQSGYQLLRLLGLGPLLLAIVLFYCWLVVRSHFIKQGKLDKVINKSCCPIQLKTGVQISGGILASLSGAALVLFFAKLDEIIGRQYFQYFQKEVSRVTLSDGWLHCSIHSCQHSSHSGRNWK